MSYLIPTCQDSKFGIYFFSDKNNNGSQSIGSPFNYSFCSSSYKLSLSYGVLFSISFGSFLYLTCTYFNYLITFLNLFIYSSLFSHNYSKPNIFNTLLKTFLEISTILYNLLNLYQSSVFGSSFASNI